MKERVAQPSAESRCKGRNRAGLPCARRATSNGYCSVHDPEHPQDMKELGREGGRASVRSRLGLDPQVADGRLREKAKARLEELLDSDDEAKRLAAARALYSFGPQRAPADREAKPKQSGGGAFAISDLIAVAAERGILRPLGLSEEGERELVDRLERARAADGDEETEISTPRTPRPKSRTVTSAGYPAAPATAAAAGSGSIEAADRPRT